MVILGFVNHFDTKIVLASFMSILTATITTSIIGIPILYYLYKDPNGKTLFNVNNMKEFHENDALLHKRIQALEKDLQILSTSNQSAINNSSQDFGTYSKLVS